LLLVKAFIYKAFRPPSGMPLNPLFYKAFLRTIGDGFVIKKEKKRGTGKLIFW
jgi:hypothetical protein